MSEAAAIGLARVLKDKSMGDAVNQLRETGNMSPLMPRCGSLPWETEYDFSGTRRARPSTGSSVPSVGDTLTPWPAPILANLCHCLGCAACRPGCPARNTHGRPCDYPLGRACSMYRERIKDVPVGFCRRCEAQSRHVTGGSSGSRCSGSRGLRPLPAQRWLQAEPGGEDCQLELFSRRQRSFLLRRPPDRAGLMLFFRRSAVAGERCGAAFGIAPAPEPDGWGALAFTCATLRGAERPDLRGGEEDFGMPQLPQFSIANPQPKSAGDARDTTIPGPRRASSVLAGGASAEDVSFILEGFDRPGPEDGPDYSDDLVLIGTVFDRVVVDTGGAHVPGLWYRRAGWPRAPGGGRAPLWRVRLRDGLPFEKLVGELEKEWRHTPKFQLCSALYAPSQPTAEMGGSWSAGGPECQAPAASATDKRWAIDWRLGRGSEA